MRLLLNEKDFDASCSLMMASLDWLNVRNMWHWCSIRTLKRIMKYPSQAPYLWSLLRQNEDPERPLRYNGLKLVWRTYSRWAYESYAYCAQNVWNLLNLHGRLFIDYEDMRDTIKMLSRNRFGNDNIK